MSGVVSLKRVIQYGLLFMIISLSGWSIASARKILLFASNAGGLYYCLQLQPTGQLVWTGEILTTGSYNTYGFAVSPDQRYLWVQYSNLPSSEGIMQYVVTPYGQITATGRSVQLPELPADISFTPNGQLLLPVPGPIFRVNPDSSIQSTSNTYGHELNISPRGDINYSQTNYPEAFQIDHIDYTSAIITTLEVVTTSDDDQPQRQAVYRPVGDYIAYTYFLGAPGGIEVRRVLPNGMVDTTQAWDYEYGNGGSYIDITPDGNNIYANNMIHLSWSNKSSMFIDSGIAASVSNPLQIKVSPDSQFLVVDYQDYNIDGGANFLKTFFIQSDGSLVDTGYAFPFTQTFGDYTNDATRLIFVWTPEPTNVPEALWKEFDDK